MENQKMRPSEVWQREDWKGWPGRRASLSCTHFVQNTCLWERFGGSLPGSYMVRASLKLMQTRYTLNFFEVAPDSKEPQPQESSPGTHKIHFLQEEQSLRLLYPKHLGQGLTVKMSIHSFIHLSKTYPCSLSFLGLPSQSATN